MTEYNSINAKLCNFELNKLKLTIKTATEVTLKLSSNMIRVLMMVLIFHINCY